MRSDEVPAGKAAEKFPPTFYYANAIELFERLAFYGMYVGLSLYLTSVIGFGDAEAGSVQGNFRFIGSLAPVFCGSIADRISFKRSLVIAFCLCALGYAALFALPSRALAPIALYCVAVGGGFMKPVITGTVVRTAPEGRQVEGFAVFYRMINAGSVIGKVLARLVRAAVGLRSVMVTSVAASLVALGIAGLGYKEPERGKAPSKSLGETLSGYGTALKDARFSTFLLIFAGFYFMAEQFYMTFPKYLTRHVDPSAPYEYITLINPALIALFQGVVIRATRRFTSITTMILGVFVGAVSMLAMGTLPGLVGACASYAIFAFAEMTFSPRFYDYIASFAPPGKAGMYMGLAFVPSAIGSWIAGQASGRLIARYLPEHGERSPVIIWSSYAALGLVCALGMLVYRAVVTRRPAPQAGAPLAPG